jgi:D-arabinose 1-dehydrogenase-like Zn-dependent alcohol dehydrogenase
VLVRLKYCGICHSDVHIREGYFDLGGGRRLTMSERGMRPPVTLGHEALGTVVAAGPAAGAAPVGEDRLVFPWIGCGACGRCSEQMDNYCMAPQMIGIQRPGGYADHLLVPHPRYLIDAAGIDPPFAATLACSGLSAYAAVCKLVPIPRDEWVVVLGAGGLGLSAIGMLRALGHDKIIAVDIGERKLGAAAAAGAAVPVDGSKPDLARKIKQAAGGPAYGAVDFVGSSATVGQVFTTLRKGGKLVLVGLFGGELALSVAETVLRAVTVQGSHLGSIAELQAVIALARAGRLKRMPLEMRPLSEVSETLDQLRAGKIIGRVVAQI